MDNGMDPDSVSLLLRRAADYVDGSPRPDRGAVRRALARALLATDRTVSVAVRDALVKEIAKLVPGEFGGETYDTNPGGKGFLRGYVSFGLDPQTWEEALIIGGILFKCAYDPEEFRSEEPDPKHPGAGGWRGRSQGALVTLQVECGYYNKLVNGSYGYGRPLGEVTVELDPRERVVEVEAADPAGFSEGVKGLIAEIAADPPAVAQSAKRQRQQLAPTGSEKSLLAWLVKNNREDVKRSELEALARAVSGRTGKAYSNALEDVTAFFRLRHMPIDPKN